MTEEKKSTAEMVRLTSNQTHEFYQLIAKHIEELEETIVKLNQEIERLTGNQNGNEN